MIVEFITKLLVTLAGYKYENPVPGLLEHPRARHDN